MVKYSLWLKHRVFAEFLLVGPVTTTQNSSVSLLFHFTVLISPLQTLTSLNKSVEGSDIRNAGRPQPHYHNANGSYHLSIPLLPVLVTIYSQIKKRQKAVFCRNERYQLAINHLRIRSGYFKWKNYAKSTLSISFAQQVKYSFLNVHSCSTPRHPHEKHPFIGSV